MIATYVDVPVGTPLNANGQRAAIAMIFIFVFFYGFFIDAASFIYSSEIYPTNIRSRGVALATTTYFLACLVRQPPSPASTSPSTNSSLLPTDLRNSWRNSHRDNIMAVLPSLLLPDGDHSHCSVFLLSRDEGP
jgi:hypothetical protein